MPDEKFLIMGIIGVLALTMPLWRGGCETAEQPVPLGCREWLKIECRTCEKLRQKLLCIPKIKEKKSLRKILSMWKIPCKIFGKDGGSQGARGREGEILSWRGIGHRNSSYSRGRYWRFRFGNGNCNLFLEGKNLFRQSGYSVTIEDSSFPKGLSPELRPCRCRREPMEAKLRLALGYKLSVGSGLTAKELTAVPGVSRRLARRIEKFLEENKISEVEELTAVRGIGEKRVKRLKLYIRK